MNRGRFITLEGIEGVGKTTHIGFIKDCLQAAGHQVLQTREPGGTRLGEAIREILLNGKDLSIAAETELLLIFSARAQHISEVIRPALNQGAVVLCDRFTDASYAYQGGGRGISLEKIGLLEAWVQGDLRPDLTLLLDAPVELGLARARADQRSQADRFETENLAFFQQVREAYLSLAAKEATRFSIIDAALPLKDVQQMIRTSLEKHELC